MHWWQGAFTSTSKSQSSDDSVIASGASSSSYSVKPGFFSSRRNRLLARARKLRQVTENDVDMWRSPGHFQNSPVRSAVASTSASPQPLPLPELRVLLQRDPKLAPSASCSVPLPSPDAIQIPRGCDDKERERETTEATNAEAIDGLNVHKRYI